MKRFRLIIFAVFLSLLLVTQVRAAGLIIDPTGQVCDKDGVCSPAYTMDDFFNQFVALTQWGLRIIMFLAVLMFIWAGLKFITAGGRSSMIDEGKKIIQGTIAGLIIALTAFVIVNTIIMALTGTSITSANVFGRIGTVFSGKNVNDNSLNGQSITRPFAGVGVTATNGTCHTDSAKWNTNCPANNAQINCSDADITAGAIHTYQGLLLEKGCTCLTSSSTDTTKGVDGCYGPATAQCVEHFQAANHLPLTGALDEQTLAALWSTTSASCDFNVSNPILSKLPKITTPDITNQSTTGTGCCLVGTADSSSYCVDGVSTNTCDSLSSVADHYDPNQYCASGKFRHICGFCSDTSVPPKAFQFATQNWCTKIAGTPNGGLLTHDLTFTEGTCAGRATVSSCTNALLLSPLP